MRTQGNPELSADRVQTGIEGFDTLIEGGIPSGSLVLLAENAGSSKTIFSAQHLYHGASKLDEPGLCLLKVRTPQSNGQGGSRTTSAQITSSSLS